MESGRDIKDKYKIEKTLAKGSQSTIKLAKHRNSNEKFAVKVFSKKNMNEKEISKIQAEIEILHQIDHPNVVRLVETFEDDKYFCLVMELMEGGEMIEKIK